MRLLLFIYATALISCGQNTNTDKTTEKKTDTVAARVDTLLPSTNPLPDQTPEEHAVNAALTGKKQGAWHVLNDKQASWMKDVYDYFIVPKRKTDPNYPYIAKGDFNGDGQPDMAAVVTDSLKKKFQLAIFIDTSKLVFWEEDILDDAAISTVPRSDIEGMDGERTKKIKMKGDGINVEYFEKASFVLYWDKSGFKRLQTGD